MKLIKKIAPLATASALALTGLAAPIAAQAEVKAKASLGVANMYLWRGLNSSPNGAQVHGTLQFDHTSGGYAGVWTTSEDQGHETDLYVGYAGKAGGIGYDVSYWNYLYPENVSGTGSKSLSDTDAAEVAIALSYGPVSFGAYIQVDSDNADDNYFTLTGKQGKYSLTYGFWDLENGTVAGASDEYSHLTLSYAATDALSFSVSKVFSDLDESDAAAKEEDPLFQVAYNWNFKL